MLYAEVCWYGPRPFFSKGVVVRLPALLLFVAYSAMTASAADSSQPVVVSAANPEIGVAPDSLATVYGSQLATETASATALPWPATLGDVSVV